MTDTVFPAHIIFTYKGKVYQNEKKWKVDRIEKALTRMGASYWEIAPMITIKN